jgi:glycosyltransferase involved in cell wall biosynthesis
MARILILGPDHPSRNPRLVRDADALVRAGHAVRVCGVRFDTRLRALDQELLKGRAWRYEAVDGLTGLAGRSRWHIARVRRRICRAIAERVTWPFIDSRAYGYVMPELTRLASTERADLVIAHQQVTLPAAARVAARWGCPYGFDAEDLLADSPDEPTHLVRRIEKLYLSGCAYVSTMSAAAAERLQEVHHLSRTPIVLHNVPWLEERAGTVPPRDRPVKSVQSIYWFGQTLGPHSCAEQMIRALSRLSRPVRFVLRGQPRPEYVASLRQLANQVGVNHLLEIEGSAPPHEMVRLAAQHNFLLGSQPGRDLFHLMAIGNKVFTGMSAGLGLALTDTPAHRRLLTESPGVGFLFPPDDPAGLADQLERVIGSPEVARGYQQTAWDTAGSRYNWDIESLRLVDTVAEVLTVLARRGCEREQS